MKSLRLSPELETLLRAAAEASGVSESEFIRQAIEFRSKQVLNGGLDEQLAGVIGAVRSRGGRAQQAHVKYRDLLKRSKSRRASASS